MATVTIDVQSPERGWQPFLRWMRDQGLDPSMSRAITFDPESLDAELTIFDLRDSKKYVDPGSDELATTTLKVRLTSLPPRRS